MAIQKTLSVPGFPAIQGTYLIIWKSQIHWKTTPQATELNCRLYVDEASRRADIENFVGAFTFRLDGVYQDEASQYSRLLQEQLFDGAISV